MPVMPLAGFIAIMSAGGAGVGPGSECDEPVISTTAVDGGGETGGWATVTEAHAALDGGSSRCNIPRVSALEWVGSGSRGWPGWPDSDQEDEMVSPTGLAAAAVAGDLQHPVVINPPGRGDWHWHTSNSTIFRMICSKSELLNRYGENRVVLSSANTLTQDDLQAHSHSKKSIKFRHYVETMCGPVDEADVRADKKWYLFGDNNYDDWTNFTDWYDRPPFDYPRDPFFSFGLGGSGTGVPFHTHGAVFAEVIYGRKRWFVTKPAHQPRFEPDVTSLAWANDVLLSLTPENRRALWDCTLGPGEVLFLPGQFWHATLNLGQTVFMSTFI